MGPLSLLGGDYEVGDPFTLEQLDKKEGREIVRKKLTSVRPKSEQKEEKSKQTQKLQT